MHLAFLSLATTLLRGTGYTPLLGSAPELATHSPGAAPHAHATRTARAVERESINLVEAVLLHPRVGEVFSASVVDRDQKGSFTIVIRSVACGVRWAACCASTPATRLPA